MSCYVIEGGRRLEGELSISGSKNAILPIVAATLLSRDKTYLEHCPKIMDVEIMIEILRQLGCHVKWDNDTLMIDTSTLTQYHMSDTLVKKMRSSIILLGALLSRCGEAQMSYPGGCQLGKRPIDLHLWALRKMGTWIAEEQGLIICKNAHLQGARIQLALPSVGATENILLAAACAEGNTIIENAAREPEIVDLVHFLNTCGAKITGAGTKTISVLGVKKLKGIHYRVIPDRIIAGTYLTAAAITRGCVTLKDVEVAHLSEIIRKLSEIGCRCLQGERSVTVCAASLLKGTVLKTAPYPGYPTDMQSQMMALLCTCSTESIIEENLFEARFKTADELIKMGANICIDGNKALIKPNASLKGCQVLAKDLRGGAALVLAGLAAEGTTVVQDISHIKRGYQDLPKDLKALGAFIEERE